MELRQQFLEPSVYGSDYLGAFVASFGGGLISSESMESSLGDQKPLNVAQKVEGAVHE